MLIYQEKNKTNELNILFNTTQPAGLTVPGDIILTKGATVTVGTITYTGVSASFASTNSVLKIDSSAPTYDYTTGKVTISGQAQLTGGSNATVAANITLPIDSLTAGDHISITNGTNTRTIAVTDWDTKLDKNDDITAGTNCKITYDAKGLVTSGAALTADDIPSLDADKITSGTFADARIASATIWNAKQNALTAGSNITITADNTISVTGFGSAATYDSTAFLAAGATAVNASSLGGHSPAYYAQASSIPTTYLKSASVNGNTLSLTNQAGTTTTFTNTTYAAATTTTEGLMSAADKTKLAACIELDGGNYYLKAGNVRTKIADIVAQIRCFREDTSYVTMYDGTTKLISEVQPGESVLGYDVNKQDYCEALVVSNDRTGEVTTFDCYVFEDGTTVDIDGIDSFLTHFMSNFEGLKPDLTDCFNVSPIDYLYNDSREKNHYFRKVIKSTGGKDNGVAVIYRRKYNCATPTGRYRIQTSNGTCFINGLCHARKPIDTVINFTTGTTAFTLKIREVFANIFARQAKGDPFLPDDHIEDTSAAGLLKELTANNAVISLKKEYLNSTDYKAMKYAEGALSEEEWLPIKTNRIAAREEINTREARNDEILPLLKATNPNLMNTYDNKYWWVEKIERAMLDFADLNSLLEDFREYLQQK